MTFDTDEDSSKFRYHIFIGDELVCLTKTMLGVRGFLLVFQQESEYRTMVVTVKDIFQLGRPTIMSREGGTLLPSAEILPFPRN